MKIKNIFERFILTLLIIAFISGNIYSQHLFSVNYNDLSRENTKRIKEQVTRSGVLPVPLTRGTNGEYDVSLSTVQNTKIIILNEETGNNVVVIPTKEAPKEFQEYLLPVTVTFKYTGEICGSYRIIDIIKIQKQ